MKGKKLKMKLFYEEELRKKSYYEMYQIAIEENLVNVHLETPTREELIALLMKYRGVKENYCIDEYNKNGLANVQHLFDSKLGERIHNENKIKVPHKIILYKELDLMKEDNYKIEIPENVSSANVFLINANNYLCGIFQLEKDLKSRNKYFLISRKKFFRVEKLRNNKFSFLFFKESDLKFIHKFYNLKENELEPLYPYQMDYYKVEIENFIIRNLEMTNTPLCIDFGTVNTAVGAYLDKNYVKELPTNDILNGNVVIDAINYVKFDDGERHYREIFPTLVYVDDCSDSKNIKYSFGYDVLRKLEKNDYIVNGSIFYSLKRWVHEHNKLEKINDEFGNILYVKRKDIIKAYLKYVVNRAEYMFKCKFKKIHASSPVKLKEQFLTMFQEIFTVENNYRRKNSKNKENFEKEINESNKFSNERHYEYEIIRENAMDEAIAVLYNTIEIQIKKGRYKENEEYSALIIDCGGGTTDLAACKYVINRDRISYYLDIRTSFENGDENFGGNDLTYRIMQFLKIVLGAKYSKNQIISINDLIKYDNDMIYKVIDDGGVEKIFEKMNLEYEKYENIIPTKYSHFENKMSEEYRKIRNNFYMLWEAAENLKKEFFTSDGRLRTRFDIPRNYEKRNDIHITQLKSWKIHTYENGIFHTVTDYPKNIFTIKEIEKIVKADIYGMLRKFLNTYYKEGLLFEYSLIKLSGQSTKISTFQEVLKEFVPGKMIEYKELSHRDDYELKLNCLDGAIKYLDYKRFGHMDVEIVNEVPLVPYSVWVEKYDGEKVEMIQTSRKADILIGQIDKKISAEELKIYVYNAEGELKKEMIYKNEDDYEEMDAEEILPEFTNIISQNDTDTIQNNTVRFFVYTDLNNWGFFIVPIQRKADQLYLGRKEYFPYEDNLSENSYFDGNH